jgi:hypothetical protein
MTLIFYGGFRLRLEGDGVMDTTGGSEKTGRIETTAFFPDKLEYVV